MQQKLKHLWTSFDDHVYCWKCGQAKLDSTPEVCIPDGSAPELWLWADGSYRGGPEPK